jgi:hypothetical protein
LVVELNAEERALARRWAIALPAFYSVIFIGLVAAMVAGSRPDKATVVASSERTELAPDRSGMRPYGSLPNPVQSPACTTMRACTALKAFGSGESK